MRRGSIVTIFAVVFVVCGAIHAFAQQRRTLDADSIAEARRKADLPRPDFSKYSTPALEDALKDPERLLAFITVPDTPYADRCAAAMRGRFVVPPEFVPRIMQIRRELDAEQAAHYFGLRYHPMDSRPRMAEDEQIPAVPRVRAILGHEWLLPAARIDYPLSFDEEAKAPWPWQVQKVIEQLYGWMLPQTHEPGEGPRDEQDRWLRACEKLPQDDDRQVWEFVQAQSSAGWTRVSHDVGVATLARWRQIALDARFPSGATNVAEDLARACRTWTDADAANFAQAITLDIIRASPNESARRTAAYHINNIPNPDAVLYATAQAAVDPNRGDAFDRLATYAYCVTQIVDDPPFRENPGAMGGPRPGSSEAQQLAERFDKWFRDHKDELARRAASREAQLKPVREILSAASPAKTLSATQVSTTTR